MGRRDSGFTLIELVAVLALSSLLLAGLAAVANSLTGRIVQATALGGHSEQSRLIAAAAAELDRISVVENVEDPVVAYLDQTGRKRRFSAASLRELLQDARLTISLTLEESGPSSAGVIPFGAGLPPNQGWLRLAVLRRTAPGAPELVWQTKRRVRVRRRTEPKKAR